jgi:steroid 5-alpha reductase family enzyme
MDAASKRGLWVLSGFAVLFGSLFVLFAAIMFGALPLQSWIVTTGYGWVDLVWSGAAFAFALILLFGLASRKIGIAGRRNPPSP